MTIVRNQKNAFKSFTIILFILIVVTLSIVSAFSIYKYKKEYERSIVVNAESLTKSFRNNILLGDIREIINNKQFKEHDITGFELLSYDCRNIFNKTKVYSDCYKRVNVLKEYNGDYAVTVPVYFSDIKKDVAKYCRFTFSTYELNKYIRHTILFFTLILVVVAFALYLNIKMYNLSLNKFIKNVIMSFRRYLCSEESNYESLMNNSPAELIPIVNELKKLTEDYIESARKLKEYEVCAAIGRTTAMVAHDIRRPLTALKSLLAVLPENRNDEIFVCDMVRKVDATITHTNAMLNEIMDLSSGNADVKCQQQNPQSLIVASLSEALRCRKNADISIEYKLLSKNYLNVDSDRILRVFTNIISNAIEAMNGRGKIWFKTEDVENCNMTGLHNRHTLISESAQNMIRIIIGNDGPVISKEVQNKMFNPFFTAGKKGGTGLGLAICRKIVELHKGAIIVKSEYLCAKAGDSALCENERKTEFVIELPSIKGNLTVNETELIRHSKELRLFIDEAAAREECGDSASVAEFMRLNKERGRPSYLLLVDDEPLFRETVRTMINSVPQVRDHVKIVETSNADEALSMFDSCEFDYVIADIDMGKHKMNGYEMSQIILEKYINTYVLIHSNKRKNEMDKNIREIKSAKFMGFLPKPMKQSELLHFLACRTFETAKEPQNLLQKDSVCKSSIDESGFACKKILILNDDETLLMSFKLLLKSAGAQVMTATKVSEALTVFSENGLDLILSDINLGDDEPDGYEFLKKVRTINKDIPFYMISGYSRSEEEPKARASGANGYLQLPLDKGQLEDVLS